MNSIQGSHRAGSKSGSGVGGFRIKRNKAVTSAISGSDQGINIQTHIGRSDATETMSEEAKQTTLVVE